MNYVEIFIQAVLDGRMALEQVPEVYRADVAQTLEGK